MHFIISAVCFVAAVLSALLHHVSSDQIHFFVSGLCFFLTLLSATLGFLNLRKSLTVPKACSSFGKQIRNTIPDEHEEQYFRAADKNTWRVKGLFVYPVKSCRGVELDHDTVFGEGMQYDRQFALAQFITPVVAPADKDDPEKSERYWKFITQRDRSELARVRTDIWLPDPSSSTYSPDHPNVQSEGVLIIKFPILEGFWGLVSKILVLLGGTAVERTIHAPLNPTRNQIQDYGYRTEKMKIWKDTPPSLVIASSRPAENDPVMRELSRFLRIDNPVALFRTPAEPNRELYRNAPSKEELGYQSRVRFQDSYPLHILNLASVRDLGSKVPKGTPKVSALQFRCNILITGPAAYAEDDWKMITIGDYKYHVVCRTTRCQVPNVNQITGGKDKAEPQKSMKSFRQIDAGAKDKACMGMMCIPSLETSEIKVGDSLHVLQTGEHYYLKAS